MPKPKRLAPRRAWIVQRETDLYDENWRMRGSNLYVTGAARFWMVCRDFLDTDRPRIEEVSHHTTLQGAINAAEELAAIDDLNQRLAEQRADACEHGYTPGTCRACDPDR